MDPPPDRPPGLCQTGHGDCSVPGKGGRTKKHSPRACSAAEIANGPAQNICEEETRHPEPKAVGVFSIVSKRQTHLYWVQRKRTRRKDSKKNCTALTGLFTMVQVLLSGLEEQKGSTPRLDSGGPVSRTKPLGECRAPRASWCAAAENGVSYQGRGLV